MNIALDLPLYETTPVIARTFLLSDYFLQEIYVDSRSTTLSAFKMALSTISGPQTKLAPCFKANSRVGTR